MLCRIDEEFTPALIRVRQAARFPTMAPLSGIHDKFPSRCSFAISWVRVVSGHSPPQQYPGIERIRLRNGYANTESKLQSKNRNKKLIKNNKLYSISEFVPASQPRNIMTFQQQASMAGISISNSTMGFSPCVRRLRKSRGSPAGKFGSYPGSPSRPRVHPAWCCTDRRDRRRCLPCRPCAADGQRRCRKNSRA